MTPAQLDDELQLADDEDVQLAVQRALEAAGVTMEELKAQAAASHFSSERARMAWFMVSAVADAP